ncbi:MAG: DNA repair protein RadA, partial [Oscillospiraceae bacterium]|nr:DNA repair protein RadA [Oscillospiraceae bacterium]
RLNVRTDNLYLASNTDVASIVDAIYAQKPDIVMVDSIQTMMVAGVSSSAGSVTQVRESTNAFLKCAKENDIPIFIVGHVNKDGAIAGPKVLEHIVDAVLYFEGERNLSYRILRAVKNRYGSTNEIGVFEMSTDGLQEVENPSMMLISGRPTNVSGTAVVCVMEGSRPVLAEVQALVTKTGFGNPRRTATGFDYNRMAMILAVLEKRVGLMFSSSDAFINIIGGLKLDEPAADLAVALALVSSFRDIVIDDKTLMMGEIGLAGEIRNISFCSQRIAEAKRLGFNRFIVPFNAVANLDKNLSSDVNIIGVKSIGEAIAALARS